MCNVMLASTLAFSTLPGDCMIRSNYDGDMHSLLLRKCVSPPFARAPFVHNLSQVTPNLMYNLMSLAHRSTFLGIR